MRRRQNWWCWTGSDDADLLRATRHPSLVTCHLPFIAHTQIPSAEILRNVCVIPHDAEAFARAIYAELHRGDEAGADWIVVEAPPDLPEWSAIADRLRRASRVSSEPARSEFISAISNDLNRSGTGARGKSLEACGRVES